MRSQAFLESLLGTKASFESALAHVRQNGSEGLLVPLIEGLQRQPDIDNAERERRLSAVFARLSPSEAELMEVAVIGATLDNAVLRNSLTQLLPPTLRGGMFRAGQGRTTNAVSPQPKALSNTQIEPTSETSTATLHEPSQFSDVIILSIIDNPPTKKLLESNAFTPLRCQSLEEVDSMLATNSEICAILVESSFVKPLDRDQQASLIVKLATFSTFIFLRFQDEGLLADTTEIAQLVAQARCRTALPEIADLSFQYSAALQERELSSLNNSRRRLCEGQAQGLFRPGELDGREVRLLGAAMSQYAKRRRFNPGAELTQVTTKFLHGGQTGARVALVKVNDLRVPVIVKLDRKEEILEEAKRFLTFIHKDNPELNPEVHLHCGAALIVFGIIQDTRGEAEQPAPTLDDQLTIQWYEEMRNPRQPPDGSQLMKAFADAAGRLASLNKQKYFARDFICKANPYLVSVKEMERQGFDWGFGDRAVSVRESAASLVGPVAEKAVCHGDAHSRNVLIRGAQGFLIDYAYSGPGHPCSDLVKLELSVYLTRFIPFGKEPEIEQLQRDLAIERLPLSALISGHPKLLRSRVNRLCLEMCVTARDLSLEVLHAHQLPPDHYVALKLLTAWQSLQVPSLQQSLVRGIISAIGS